MLIRSDRLFTGHGFQPGTLTTEGDTITIVNYDSELLAQESADVLAGQEADQLTAGFASAAGEADEVFESNEVLDASGCYVIPGFIDLHFHGCQGFDLCDGSEEALSAIASYEASRGVTGINPATMTYPELKLETVMEAVAAHQDGLGQAALLGINMEGPYLSPNKVGAQNPAYVRKADLEEFHRLQKASGNRVTLVDVAPETEGAVEFIKEVSGQTRVSVAHTTCTYDQAVTAFKAGARQMTHLYNAMPGLHHRNPGPIAAAAERDDVMVEIITDGVHIHPAMVRLAFSLFGSDRVIMISDSMRACGLADGLYDLGGQEVTVQGRHATLADGTLAGSVSDLHSCFVTAVKEMGIPLAVAVRAASLNPATALGIEERRGSLEAGKIADIVILNEDLTIRDVILRGELL